MSSKRQSSKTGRKKGWNGPLTTVYEGATMKSYKGFSITPGKQYNRTGLIAHRGESVVWFPLNASSEAIKSRLDKIDRTQ